MDISFTEFSDSTYNYLDAIFHLQNEAEEVFSVDIALHMNVSKPSVCEALKKLNRFGLIYRKKRAVKLTDLGDQIAKIMKMRYTVLYLMFIKIGVNKKTAEDDALKLARTISSETFERFALLTNSSVFPNAAMAKSCF